jgi:hypothetical protein
MSKVIAAIIATIFALIGLDLILGGTTLITPSISLVIAGFLMILVAINMAIKMKWGTTTPNK